MLCLSLLILLSACGGKEQESQQEKIESPPSLQNKEQLAQKVILTKKTI